MCIPGPGNGAAGGDGADGQPSLDSDGDGWPDGQDNCPNVANSDQADMDNDGKGDACDENAERNGINRDVVAFWTGANTAPAWDDTEQVWLLCVDRYIKVLEIAQAILQLLGNAPSPLNVQLIQLLGGFT